MTRRHADPVEVRTHADVPAQFLWRGRLYAVAEVLACWTESGCWWRAPAVTALSSGEASSSSGGPVGVDDGERTWWRVEAAAGRSSGSGVYDLCVDTASGGWSLARILD
jgi:hypothetical protein